MKQKLTWALTVTAVAVVCLPALAETAPAASDPAVAPAADCTGAGALATPAAWMVDEAAAVSTPDGQRPVPLAGCPGSDDICDYVCICGGTWQCDDSSGHCVCHCKCNTHCPP